MKVANQIDGTVQPGTKADTEELFTLLAKDVGGQPFAGVVTGQLVALANEGRTPLVLFPGQPTWAAVAARSIVDLHGAHVGQQVVLVFEGADPAKPIVMGVLRDDASCQVDDRPGQVDVSPDGQRLIVTAKEQLVLRCGKASITLTKAGNVLIEGKYISSRASGVNRIKGGSVQLN